MNAESFNLDHRTVHAPFVRIADRKALPGGDVLVKYDVRFCQPNVEHLETPTVHAIEHMTAEFMRNHTDQLIDWSPMGCRTGFYALTLELEPEEFFPILEATFRDILHADQVPAANEVQCGWGAHHSLAGAKVAVKRFLDHRDEWGQVFHDTAAADSVHADSTDTDTATTSIPPASVSVSSPTAASGVDVNVTSISSIPGMVNMEWDRTAITGNVDAVVLFAMPEEAKPVLPHRDPVRHVGPFVFYRLDMPGTVLATISGIGLANATQAAQAAIQEFHPAHLLACGTAGGLGQAHLGDVIVGSTYRYSDADATAFDYEIGQIPRMPALYHGSEALCATALNLPIPGIRPGQIVSGNSFITSENTAHTVMQLFPEAMAADMESAALAQVAYRTDTPFVAIRAISDLCGQPHGGHQFDTHADNAIERVTNTLQALMEHMSQA